MIDERQVFDRFHEAFDVQPRLGAIDRLEAALAHGSVRSRPRPGLVLQLPRLGLRVAAGVVAALLLAALLAAYLAAHLQTNRPVPVRPGASNLVQVLPQRMFGNVGWAFGMRTTDGGLHWRDVSPPSPTNLTKGGHADYVLDANHAWVTVATGQDQLRTDHVVVFATSDGGLTWLHGVPVPASGAGSVNDVLDFIDAEHGWLMVDSGAYAADPTGTSIVAQPITRTVYATADGGINWTLIASGNESDRSTLGSLALDCSISGLTFVNVNRGWLTWDCNSGVGPTKTQQSAGSVAVTQDGGRSWQAVEFPSYPSTSDWVCGAFPPVFTLNQGVLPVECGGISHPGWDAVYGTDDAGRTWSFRKLPFFVVPDFVDANHGWAINPLDKALYGTTGGGRKWTKVRQFSTDLYSGAVWFRDSKTGFVLTTRYSTPDRATGVTTMEKTVDGGKTWSEVSSQVVGPPI